MTEDCDTGIYGVKPWTNQRVAPKPHSKKTPNPDKKNITHKHAKKQEYESPIYQRRC